MSDRERAIVELIGRVRALEGYWGADYHSTISEVVKATNALHLMYPRAEPQPPAKVYVTNGRAYRDHADAVKDAARQLEIDGETASRLFTRPDVRQWVGTHNGDKPNGANIEPMEVL